MTKFRIRKRVLPLILAVLTVFMAAFTPYHTIEIKAADIGLTYGIVDTSYEILQWIFLMMGIGGFQAPNVGVEEDEKGRVVDEFCKEFFCDTWDQWCDQNGIDPSAFKDNFIDCLNQDYDAAKYVAGDIKSSVIDPIYNYICSEVPFYQELNNYNFTSLATVPIGESFQYYLRFGVMMDGKPFYNTQYTNNSCIIDSSTNVYPLMLLMQTSVDPVQYSFVQVLFSTGPFSGWINSSYRTELGNYYSFYSYGAREISNRVFDTTFPYFAVSTSQLAILGNDAKSQIEKICDALLNGTFNLDLLMPGVSDSEYAFDLVGTPWTLENEAGEKVTPWDGVDSLPIPGDIAIGDSFPGVVDLPGIETGVIDGSIPWPDIIQMIKDIDTTPDPGPEPDPDPDKPDDEVELPAILPDGVGDKLNELKKKFPFCIPFDLVNCIKSVGSSNATPPKFTVDIPIPTTDKTYTFTVDLEMFSPYIGVFKVGIFAIFLIGLMLSTRKLIAWQID